MAYARERATYQEDGDIRVSRKAVGCRAGCALLAVGFAVLTACGGARDEERVVHVYNWVDFIGKTTIADFEAQTGIKVVYDTYDNVEMLEAKLLTGGSGYDVVFPSSTYVGRLATAGALMPLDQSKLNNLGNLDPEIMRQVALNDPGNKYAIAYTWGTVGIAYNPALIQKALGTTTIDSWSAIFDPESAAKLSGCGITLLDSRDDVFEAVEVYLGTDPGNEDLQELASAEQALKRVSQFIRKYDSSEYAASLTTGETCIALGWSGVKRIARSRQDAISNYSPIEYVIPREGAPSYFDTVAIVADAPNPDNAHAFLNFLMQPEVIAGVTNTVGYANANISASPFVDAELRDDAGVYPGAETRARLRPARTHSHEYTREIGRAWTRVKTGQ